MRRYFSGERPNAEFTQREHQAMPDATDNSGYLAGAKVAALALATPGEPNILYDVRCVYDSRPVAAYDFNYVSSIAAGAHGATVVTTFQTPSGYRAVPREWSIEFIPTPVADLTDVQIFLQAQGADVPNNSRYIGSGTTSPIRSFFVVEENATFGVRIVDIGGVLTGNIIVQCYGNLLPVTGVALPFEVTNRKV